MFLIYSTDFKDEAKLREKVLGTANWLISRTHPLIHLQLRFPFLKPQSAEQCLKELSSALETALGIGGSCWLTCGREYCYKLRDTVYTNCELGTPLGYFDWRALSACLVHVITDTCPEIHSSSSWLGVSGKNRRQKCRSHILTHLSRTKVGKTLHFTWICSETKGRPVCHKSVHQANKCANCRLCKLFCKAHRAFWSQSEECQLSHCLPLHFS